MMLPTLVTHDFRICVCVVVMSVRFFVRVSVWLLMGPEVLSETDSVNFRRHTHPHPHINLCQDSQGRGTLGN